MDWQSAEPFVGEKGVLVAGYADKWTIFCDDGAMTSVIFDDLNLADTLARQFNTQVVSALGDDTDCIYGFRVHSKSGTRAVLVGEEVEEDTGEPIPGEPPVVAEDFQCHDQETCHESPKHD